ncbi:MAG: peptide ABC transporter substrate-binding protein [Treponema sp.]|jgi:oligopeptide transport system substrate-binding protein|nr:peptide ABC transporter substrate-binding protein [Treponema sp.]
MVKRIGFLLMGLTLLAMSVSASAGRQPAAASGSQISLVLGSEPNTIDPALNSSVDGAIYIGHLFEGLYKYADNGHGRAQAVPGLAVRAPQKTVNADGTVTYVFTLRDNLKWSDGQAFTAKDIVFTWQRLVDPATTADYSYMIDMVKNANEIMAGQVNKSQLGVRAIDDKTLEVIITYDCPFFFEIMTFPATFPVRESVINSAGDQWTFSPSTYISNGPYRLKEWVHNSYILVEKNPNYYAPVSGPDNLRFMLMDDANAILAAFRNKEVDFIENVPVDEIPGLLASGELQIADYLGTYFVSINNQKAPFTDPRVRKAFLLAIDRNYIVEQITRTGEKPASGFVPSGLYDAAGASSDFRQTGGDYYSIAKDDYAKNIAEAQRLLAEAGYPNGQGFPVVEYLYNTDDRHRAIGEALQDMWRTALNVTVTLGNQDWAVFLDTRKNGDYVLARDGWIGDYNDPINFLDMFLTGGGNNNSQYKSPVFDALIAEAKATPVQTDRMRYLHQAEDLFLAEDAALAPIYFYTQPYMINPKLSGMYYTPLGYFFFQNVQIAP